MAEAALLAAHAVGYRGAGTVEFMVDGARDFFFLEMNTRLQVEHPVTEFVTGIDLVQWQIRIARGEELDFAQEDVSFSGHAIECRITSEDPHNNFLPSTGRVDRLDLPDGPGVRWDGGIREGFEVGLYYDPLLAKLIVHAATREQAIDRMGRALDELVIAGIETSASFHRGVMDEEDFRSGRLSTSYLEEHSELLEAGNDGLQVSAVAAAVLEHRARQSPGLSRIGGNGGVGLSPWRASGWPWTS
jgi:acetyl-CoA carboxylase biotin carboxylase subunit